MEQDNTMPTADVTVGRTAGEVIADYQDDFEFGNPYDGYAGALETFESRDDIEALAVRRDREVAADFDTVTQFHPGEANENSTTYDGYVVYGE